MTIGHAWDMLLAALGQAILLGAIVGCVVAVVLLIVFALLVLRGLPRLVFTRADECRGDAGEAAYHRAAQRAEEREQNERGRT